MKSPIESGIVVLLLLLNNYHEVQGIFFTTIGLTGATTSTAVITQSAALLPVLGLLALAAKVTKLKLSQNQNTGYGGGGGGGYGYGQGGGQGGFGHGGGYGGGGGGGGGGFGGGHGHYSSFHHKRIGRRDVQEARTLERPRMRGASALPQPRSSGPFMLSSKVKPGPFSPTPQDLPQETIDQSKKIKELNGLEEIFKTINLLDHNFDCVKLHLCAIGKDSSSQVKSGAMTRIDEGIGALLSKMCPAIQKNSSLEPSCKAFLIGKSAKINDECYAHFNKCSLDSSILGQTGENTPALV